MCNLLLLPREALPPSPSKRATVAAEQTAATTARVVASEQPLSVTELWQRGSERRDREKENTRERNERESERETQRKREKMRQGDRERKREMKT